MAPLSDSDPRLDGSELPTRIGIRGNEDRTIVDFGPSEPTAITPVTFELPPPHEEIEAEAYAIYEARGGRTASMRTTGSKLSGVSRRAVPRIPGRADAHLRHAGDADLR